MMERTDTRLIERWLPIAALGVESLRENGAAIKATPNRLHIWWARRPLVAARAAVLASILPADTEHERFLRILGIHGDPVLTRQRLDQANRTNERLESDPYGYRRAFLYPPTADDLEGVSTRAESHTRLRLLDPTAGGGAIVLEGIRLGLDVIGNDLNPVAAFIEKMTVEAPRDFGKQVASEFQRLARRFIEAAEGRLQEIFPSEQPDTQVLGYLWARTVHCPYCAGLVPLSPNWRLAPDGTGIRLKPVLANGPNSSGRICKFEVVKSASDQSQGTVSGGDATCPYPDCGRVISGDDIKTQAQSTGLGEQLYSIVYKRRVRRATRNGRARETWERSYRAAAERDDVLAVVKERLEARLAGWEVLGIAPNEPIPDGLKTAEPIRYGARLWRDLFNARQLYGHCVAVEVFRDLLQAQRSNGELRPDTTAAFGYLAIALDKMVDWNSRLCTWHPGREVVGHTFQRHDFAFIWQYAEMAPVITGRGYDWALGQVGKCLRELVDLLRPHDGLLSTSGQRAESSVHILCEDAAHLQIAADSVDVVVIDPPYGGNVMYAELSDFFYVWLKRTAGLIYPELFRRSLTDKEHEAVANPAFFRGAQGAQRLADERYRKLMAAIFAECRRVLKSDGMMTVMFTHKDTGAWDALTQSLIEAGFFITASWPVNTESEASLHIREKAAANSTIFLTCRPRMLQRKEAVFWDELEAQVREAVRRRVVEFQEAGITGVDLYLASFGPALEVFSRHWPVQRVTPRPALGNGSVRRRRRKADSPNPIDPYAVTPEDALDAARAEVKRWRLEQLSLLAAREGLDPITSWFVLAWDTFRAAVFPYDEALRLARVCGVSLDDQIPRVYAAKKGDNLTLWDSATRASAASLGPADGSRSMLDAVHHAAYLARTKSLDSARALLDEHQLTTRPSFIAAFDAVRQVLPVSQNYSGIALPPVAVGAGDDFRALEQLRALLYATQLQPPHQLELLSTNLSR